VKAVRSNKTRKIKAAALAAVSMALLATSALSYGPFYPPATRYVQPGDSVILHQDISAASGAKIYLQGGAAIKRSEVRWAEPFCYFHLYRSPEVVDTEATLSADSFDIESIVNHIDLAGLDYPAAVFAGMAGFITQDASEQTLITRFKLHSSAQPEVIGLNCGIWAVPNERNHLSLEEVRGALGDAVTVTAAKE